MKKRICAALMVPLFFSIAGLQAEDSAKQEKPAVKTKQIKARDLALTIPETWKQKTQSSEMRVAELEVPATGDDKESGEFVVFWFGERGAGGVQANIQRWIGQLEEEGRKVKVVTGEATGGKYTLVDLKGTYNKSIGPPIAKKTRRLPDWRVINVFIETEAGPYFLKLDGPEKTIAAVENEFRAAFGGKKESEKEQKRE
jgi:gluconolactonase